MRYQSHRPRSAIGISLLIVLLAATACGVQCGPSPAASSAPSPAVIELAAANVPRATPAPGSSARAAAAVNGFGLDLYRQVGAAGGNFVVSPASIAIALSMARAGARGETATQMDAVLHAGPAGDLGAAINALDQALASRSGSFRDAQGNDLPVALRIANAPFAQVGMPLEPHFLDALASDFGAGLRLVDYADPEAARQAINLWVSDHTEKRIPQLLAPGVITPATRMTLVNAIYLKAPWLFPFGEVDTKPSPFRRSDGTSVEVPMMAGGGEIPFAAGDGWKAVELPYVGGSLALMVIVPDDLARFETGLGADQFSVVTGALRERQVTLGLPKFSIDTRASLAEVLGALGMPLAFDPDQADFSGITIAERLFISAVIHQANIDVDEKGTEAAAATAVAMAAAAQQEEPVSLTVDRPFLFALLDRPSGAILFLGRVVDPSATP